MSRWFPESSAKAQSGMALFVTLIMLVVLMAMSAGLAYVGATFSDTLNGLANKPASLSASDSCVDQTIDWLGTTTGRSWLQTGTVNTPKYLAASGEALYGKGLLSDTVPITSGDSRTASHKASVGNATFDGCTVMKLSVTTVRGTGSEVGTQTGYGSSSLNYVIKINAIAYYGVSLSGTSYQWKSNASRVKSEAIIEYAP